MCARICIYLSRTRAKLYRDKCNLHGRVHARDLLRAYPRISAIFIKSDARPLSRRHARSSADTRSPRLIAHAFMTRAGRCRAFENASRWK